RTRIIRGCGRRMMNFAFIRGARPSRVLVLLSRQHELPMKCELKKKVRRRETQRPTRETRMFPNPEHSSRVTSHKSSSGRILSFLQTQLEAGRQLYVIYPLIDESERLDIKAASAEYDLWRERLHPYRCELLHGRVPAPEKQQIMERFRRGDTNTLISTTVIEV